MSVTHINEVVLQLKGVRSTLLSIVKIYRLLIGSAWTEVSTEYMRFAWDRLGSPEFDGINAMSLDKSTFSINK